MEYQASDNNDIGNLKNIVQQAKRNSELRDVDATKLTLWKVSMM